MKTRICIQYVIRIPYDVITLAVPLLEVTALHTVCN